ncbi:uncharacterized protein BKCO1_8500014 [Diplodia corticola]|uniref:Uncharacterized protein n=1 Tax=Diplodia corticola TaxID=236234 RepID=A0A1J9RLA3_9PEZI|nr:uncharacterized protein BKCO1_8500014 [Diplodia corticola]OJD29287.1 hypothetical protein BKCO1_8500014 [Diplodia corticola]
MDADDKADGGKKRITVPLYLRRSGIKINDAVCAESPDGNAPPQLRSSNSHQPTKPRGFLNQIVPPPPTPGSSPPVGTTKVVVDHPKGGGVASCEDSSHAQSIGEEEGNKDTESSGDGSVVLTPSSSVAADVDCANASPEAPGKATTTTAQPMLSSQARAAYEVAREYQRRVDRGEERAPTDQDRANYTAWWARKRKRQEEEDSANQESG